MRFHAFLAADFSFLMVGFQDVGEGDLEGCGRLSIHDGLLDVAWFTSWVVRWLGMNASGVVVGESTSALGERRVCVEVVGFV
jgi:hypothetical protein